MKKLQEINVIVQLLTDKLHETRAELVVNNGNCHKWNFQKFIENLEKWARQNPAVSRNEQIRFQSQNERILQISQKHCMKNHYIFCEEAPSKATDFQKVANINERKWILASKNCTSIA